MEHSNRIAFADSYFDRLTRLLTEIDRDSVARFITTLMEARARDSQIFFIGNGGSASTASHFANDISIGTRSVLKPFRVISLCDNNSIITAIGNDYGYDQIFVKQLQVLLKPKDVVVAISASGNSINLLKAIEYAKHARAYTVGLTGFDGGKLRTMVDLPVHIPSNKGEYGPVEDAHMILDHLVGACLAREVKLEAEMDSVPPIVQSTVEKSPTLHA